MHTRLDDVKRGMPSSPLDNTHYQNTLGMACHHGPRDEHMIRRRQLLQCHQRPWAAHTGWRRREWHARLALVQHTRSDNVEHRMPSAPLCSRHSRTTMFVACDHQPLAAHTVRKHQAWHHHPWKVCTIGRCKEWHVIITLGKHTRSDYVGRGMHEWTLRNIHGQMMSGITCHHRHWATNEVEQHLAWHFIFSHG